MDHLGPEADYSRQPLKMAPNEPQLRLLLPLGSVLPVLLGWPLTNNNATQIRLPIPGLWLKKVWQLDNFYLRREQRIFNGEKIDFSKWLWENWIFTCKWIKLGPNLIPLTKVNLKWIKDLKLRLETIKTLEEKRVKKLLYWSL